MIMFVSLVIMFVRERAERGPGLLSCGVAGG